MISIKIAPPFTALHRVNAVVPVMEREEEEERLPDIAAPFPAEYVICSNMHASISTVKFSPLDESPFNFTTDALTLTLSEGLSDVTVIE